MSQDTATEVSFRPDCRTQDAALPPAAWSEVTSEGGRIVIRTHTPARLLAALCDGCRELAELEVRPAGQRPVGEDPPGFPVDPTPGPGARRP